MPIGPAEELAPVISQDGPDLHAVLLEEAQDVVVQHLDRGHRHLACEEPDPHVAAGAVEYRLDVGLADALECAREEGVQGNKVPPWH